MHMYIWYNYVWLYDMYIHIYIYTWLCIYIHKYEIICYVMCIYAYTYMYIHMYIRIHVYTIMFIVFTSVIRHWRSLWTRFRFGAGLGMLHPQRSATKTWWSFAVVFLHRNPLPHFLDLSDSWKHPFSDRCTCSHWFQLVSRNTARMQCNLGRSEQPGIEIPDQMCYWEHAHQRRTISAWTHLVALKGSKVFNGCWLFSTLQWSMGLNMFYDQFYFPTYSSFMICLNSSICLNMFQHPRAFPTPWSFLGCWTALLPWPVSSRSRPWRKNGKLCAGSPGT